jgi:hypothetical protein
MSFDFVSKFDTMVAYYPFTGNAKDNSGYGNDGTATNATLTTDKDGHTNSAYLFNGTTGTGSSRIIMGTAAIFRPTVFTVSCWIKTNTSVGNYKSWVCYGPANWNYGPAWQLTTTDSPNGNAAFQTWTSGGGFKRIKSAALNTSTWYFVCGTYDGTYMRFYVNGAEQTAGGSPLAATISYTNQAEGLTVGVDTQSSDGSFVDTWNGIIDDVRLYSFAMTGNEVTGMYNRKCY